MNLTDFRDQLAARAAETDRPQPDPLPALRGRIRTTKRRRVAVTATGAALAVVLAATVIPAGLRTSSRTASAFPEPSAATLS